MAVLAAKYPNVIPHHGTLVEGKRSQTIPHKGLRKKNKGGNPEYLRQKKYGANKGVGEIPLNGKGMLLFIG